MSVRSISSVLVAGTLAISGFGLLGLQSQSVVQAADTPPIKKPDTGRPAPHLKMHDALVHLREAKASLETANHEFAGHRATALKLTEQAIKEIEAGLKAAPK